MRGFEVHWGREHDDTRSARGDVLYGMGGHDTVSGRGGPDRHDRWRRWSRRLRARFGGTMRDTTVRGGPGEDVFRFPDPIASLDSDGVRALLRGSRGTDRPTFAHSSHGVRVDVRARLGTWTRSRITFTTLEEYHGSRRSDRLLGSSAADRIVGHRGDDVLRGRGGRDRLHGGDGPDVLRRGEGRDLLHGGKGPDVLRGDKGRDKAYGERDRDRCSAEVRVSC